MAYKIKKLLSEKEIDRLRRGDIVDFDLSANFPNYIGKPIGPVVYEGRMKESRLFFGFVPDDILPNGAVFQARLKRKYLTAKPDGRLGLLPEGEEEIVLADKSHNKRLYQRALSLLSVLQS